MMGRFLLVLLWHQRNYSGVRNGFIFYFPFSFSYKDAVDGLGERRGIPDAQNRRRRRRQQ
jgi:hypothetical protein